MAVAWREPAAGRVARRRVALGSVRDGRSARRPRRRRSSAATARSRRPPAEALAAEIHPIDDVRSTADYRRVVAARALHRIVRDAGGWSLSPLPSPPPLPFPLLRLFGGRSSVSRGGAPARPERPTLSTASGPATDARSGCARRSRPRDRSSPRTSSRRRSPASRGPTSRSSAAAHGALDGDPAARAGSSMRVCRHRARHLRRRAVGTERRLRHGLVGRAAGADHSSARPRRADRDAWTQRSTACRRSRGTPGSPATTGTTASCRSAPRRPRTAPGGRRRRRATGWVTATRWYAIIAASRALAGLPVGRSYYGRLVQPACPPRAREARARRRHPRADRGQELEPGRRDRDVLGRGRRRGRPGRSSSRSTPERPRGRSSVGGSSRGRATSS